MGKATVNQIVDFLLEKVTSADAKNITTQEAFNNIVTLERVVAMAAEAFKASHGGVLGPLGDQARDLKAVARLGLETQRLSAAATEFMASGKCEGFMKAWNESESFHPSICGVLEETADFCVTTLAEAASACTSSGQLDKQQWQSLHKLALEISEALHAPSYSCSSEQNLKCLDLCKLLSLSQLLAHVVFLAGGT